MTKPHTKYIFMSYSRMDQDAMWRIANFLRKEQRINLWVDNEKLTPGTPIWEEALEKAIISASAVIVIMSPESKKSKWVRSEIALAEQHGKAIFPVLLGGSEESAIPIRLINSQYVDIRQNEESGIRLLGTILSSHLRSRIKRTKNREINSPKQKLSSVDEKNSPMLSASGQSLPSNWSARIYQASKTDASSLAKNLQNYLRQRDFETQFLTQSNNFIVQGRKEGRHNLVGMALAVTILIEAVKDQVKISIGGGKWLDKIAVGAGTAGALALLGPIGLLPAVLVGAAASSVGVWQERVLSDDLWKVVDQMIISSGGNRIN